jgi:HdeA/HdeB family
MTVRLAPLWMLATLLWPAAAPAQATIDVAKITCKQFMFGTIADSRTISIWLAGYYNGTHNDTVVDVTAMQEKARELVRYCMANSDTMVMEATKNVLGMSK